MPKLDGRNMVMVLAPDKRAKAAHDKAKAEAETQSGDAPVEAAADEPGSDPGPGPVARSEERRHRPATRLPEPGASDRSNQQCPR